MKPILVSLLLLAILLGGFWTLRQEAPVQATDPALDPTQLLGDGSGFAAVDGPWEFAFPRDHGAHPDFHTEVWNLTGHLAADQRRFAFQWMLVRVGLKPGEPQRESAWATHQVYRGQWVLSDPAAGRRYAFERYSRAALGLAGADTEPPRVWLENWSLNAAASSQVLALEAGQDGIHLTLDLSPAKPLILPRDGTGGPFHGYAASRLTARGQVRLNDETYPVTGSAWLDRAWGELPLGGGAVARDRLLLQLNDGRELAVSRLRRRDGSGIPVTTGLWISPQGDARPLGRKDLDLEITRYDHGDHNNVPYPAGWQLRLPESGLELTVEPLLTAQTATLTPGYHSLAVQARGRNGDGTSVAAQGHVELMGYDRPAPAPD